MRVFMRACFPSWYVRVTPVSHWTRYFANDPVTAASRQGAPLRRSGRLYSFIHKSIPEYFVAVAMWADVLRVADACAAVAASGGVSGPAASSGSSGVEAEDGVTDGDAAVPAAAAATVAVAPLATCLADECALNVVPLTNQPPVLSFLADMLRGLPVESITPDVTSMTLNKAVDALHAIVRASVTRAAIGVAAANSASVLAQAGVSLAEVDWERACLKGAVLSDAVLYRANLRFCDLRDSR